MNRKLFTRCLSQGWSRRLTRPWNAVSLIACLTIVSATPVAACGPYELITHFWHPRAHDLPLARLVAGEIAPFETLRPLEAFVVYRLLRGPTLDSREQEQLLPWYGHKNEAQQASTDAWAKARRAIDGTAPVSLRIYRDSTDHGWFANCLDDAFRTATQTLKAHIARWGAASEEVRAWLHGQDQVFANCHKGRAIPEPLDASWNPRLRHDRVYQIAAAHLYADSWPEAESRFLDIAGDPDSPWNLVSGIVAARAMKRQGKLGAASTQLRHVLADDRAAEFHPAAEGLLRHIRYRTEPSAQHAETRAALLAARLPTDFARVWKDYRWGLRAGLGSNHDLDLWMRLMTNRATDAAFPGRHGLRERRQHAPDDRLWRFAALVRGDRLLPELDDVLAAVDRIPADAPERTGALFHRVRLLIDAGRLDEARARIAALRPLIEARPLGSRNRLRTLEALLAEDVRGFVETAHGKPVGAVWEGGFEVDLAQYDIDPDAPLLLDVALPLVQHLPIAALAALVTEARLPPISRNHILSVAFSRALIVNDPEQASALAPQVVEHLPALAGAAKDYLQSAPEQREFAAALVLLASPAASPFFHFGAAVPWHWGWWCQGLDPAKLDEPLNSLLASTPMLVPEQAALAGMTTAPEHLAEIVFRWAETHRDHPRIPEALHRVVVLTRRACGTRFGTISKHAFTLLHRRYPRDPWTKKTPYWFGD